MQVVDAHQHVGTLTNSFSGALTEAPWDAQADSDTRLGVMDDCGVRATVLFPSHSYLRADGIADTRRVNDSIAAYRDAAPDRFIGAGGIVEPLYGERGLAEIDRMKEELGMVAVSFHTRFQGVTLTSPWVERYIARIVELGMVPVLHAIADHPDEALWRVLALAPTFADTEMLVYDGFSCMHRVAECLEVARAAPNLVFDTGLAKDVDFIAAWIAEFGPDRLVYGSDLYTPRQSHRQAAVLTAIREAPISEEAKRKVAGETIVRVLGLDAPARP
ncbi:MAG: amidohydrolase family protein [Microbacterium sp.]|nr:amidohydrolase family protein [Microbacterium sp.]